MKIHHFIVPVAEFKTENIVVIDPGVVHQIHKVLKLQAGEQVNIGDGTGLQADCLITEIDKEKIVLQVLDRQTVSADSRRAVTLYCALLKGDHFEWVVQKATEAGVAKIVPLLTNHTIKTGWSQLRLEKIIKEAAEQCGRAVLPILVEPLNFSQALTEAAKNDLNIFFDLSDKMFDKKLLAKNVKTIGLFIGPEGGWNEQERADASGAKLTTASLGKLVLRAETAATVATWLAVNV